MFGIGATEMMIIGIVLLIAVGPTKLPQLLKAVVKGYREFRRATRELRASSGIDEILRDEDLRDLRKPFSDVLANKPFLEGKPAPKKRALSYTERIQENPPEGVDLAEIREAENQPSKEKRDAIIAAKNASLADEDAIRQAKIAAAELMTPVEVPPAPGRDASEREPDEDERTRQDRIDAKIATAGASEEEPAEPDEPS